jgi:steroid delta-isomerase-like uncharacterized protein
MTSNFLSHIQKLTDAWNSHDLELVLPFYSQDYEGMDIGEPQLQHGREAVKAMLLRYWQAFPDLRFHVTGTVADENCVAISWRAEGTQKGTIMNIPPTGRRIEIRGISMIEIQDDLVVRGEYIWDLAGMLRHMGLLPAL